MTHESLIGRITVLLLAVAPPSAFALQLKNAAVHFAAPAEGQQILGRKDDFVARMSPFDRAARLKVNRTVSEEEYLTFVRESVRDWPTDERRRIESIIRGINERLRDLALSLPGRIVLITTSGREEGNSAYTRGNAIVLPRHELEQNKNLERLVSHELFHVLSRHNHELRDRLYAAIGFAKCEEALLPRELESQKITNPDAPRNDHFIKLAVDGNDCAAVPVLIARTPTYDPVRGGEFFEYLQLMFLVAATPGDLARADAASRRMLRPEQVSGFFEQVGRNTKYILHPEEILAENFAILLLKNESVASPEVLDRMERTLRQR